MATTQPKPDEVILVPVRSWQQRLFLATGALLVAAVSAAIVAGLTNAMLTNMFGR